MSRFGLVHGAKPGQFASTYILYMLCEQNGAPSLVNLTQYNYMYLRDHVTQGNQVMLVIRVVTWLPYICSRSVIRFLSYD